MLYTVLLNIYTYFIVLNFGMVFCEISFRIGFLLNRETNFFKLSFVGLAFLALILGFISIFLPINEYVVASTTLVATVIFFLHIRLWKETLKDIIIKSNSIFYGLTFLLITFYAIKSDYLDNDVGYYHAQFIQWVEKYSVVPGLGNISAMFGYNSHFDILSAFFSFSFVGTPFHTLNAWLVITFCLYCLNRFFALPSINMKLISLFFFTSCIFVFRGRLSLPYPDISIAIITWFSFFLLIEKIEAKKIGIYDNNSFYIITLLALAVTIKLSSVIIFGLASIYIFILYFKSRKSIADGIKYLLFLFILLLPWFIRNVILTGYLIYPMPYLDFFDFQWKIPTQDVIKQKNLITLWETAPYLIKTTIIQQLDSVPKVSILTYFPHWLSDNKYFYFFMASTVASIGVLIIRWKNMSSDYRRGIVGILFSISIATTFWLFNAPGIRFIIGSFCIILSLPLMLINIPQKISGGIIQKMLTISLSIIMIYFFIWPIKNSLDAKYIFLPEGRYKKTEIVQIKINNIKFILPKKGIRCWNMPLPCITCKEIKVKLIGKNIESGFMAAQ